MPLKKKLTDGAVIVEFDFRCIINGKPYIIEMQRGYLDDVVQRFYLYFTVDTALQLENLPLKAVQTKQGEVKKVASYLGVEPVITLIWMADDTLGTDEYFLSFSMLPEELASFIKDDAIWKNQDLESLTRQREKLLALQNNKTKSLDFLSKNRLIFAFQKNIVKNKPKAPYFKWFDFAEKTKNKNNRKEDFKEYLNDKDMITVIERINQEVLDEEDFDYLDEFEAERNAGKMEGRMMGEVEGIAKGRVEGIQIGIAKTKVEERKKRQEEKLRIARRLKRKGIPTEVIMEATKLTRQVIEKL